ncbi:hypothetical protein [Nostoc sp. ChiQUE01b]|uniref:hypothetical protein n=1 Tax=Nostoc sp. ChiQUE01b TaxID=3075376 RepID=UPI002AD30917|nr:hypothetical protein [Nostoc sp. ChiQUE01b]
MAPQVGKPAPTSCLPLGEDCDSLTDVASTLCISSILAIALQPFGHPTAGVGKAITFMFNKSKFAKFLY